MNPNNTPKLIVQTSSETRLVELIEHTEWTVGRDRANLIQIKDRYASRFHAVLGVFEDRHIYYRDLKSRNGSLLNGQPIPEPTLLKHGDRILIGQTEMVLKHEHVTTVHVAFPQHQALMIHASAIQGKIWQEILLSQAIDILWEVPGADLKNTIGLKASANVLPPLLIIDLHAMVENMYGLAHWCHSQGLTVQILLIDSSRFDIPKSEQAYFTKLGFLNLLPAFPVGQLATIQPDIFQTTLTLLQLFQPNTFNPEGLLSALQSLDTLLNQQGPALGMGMRLEELEAMNSEDLTSLTMDPRKLKRNKMALLHN